MAVFTLTTGIDNFTGANGVVDSFDASGPGTLTSADTISGGTGVDFMTLGAGAHTAADFASVTGIENIAFFSGASASLTLTAALGATAANRRLHVQTDIPLTLDGSAFTAADQLDFSWSGTAAGIHVTMGAGNDNISLNAPLHAGDTINGGGGDDIMFINSGGPLGVNLDGNISNIERIALLSGSSISIRSGFTVAGGVLKVTLNAGANAVTVAAGSTVALSALCFDGQDTVNVSALVIRNDEVEFDPLSLAATDVINCGGGTGDTLRFRTEGVITSAQLTGVRATENVRLDGFGDNSIDLRASMLVGVASSRLDVEGGQFQDFIDGRDFGAGQVLDAQGFGGADTLLGGDGDDILNGGAGADQLFGGGGSDTASYAGAAARVKVALDGSIVFEGDALGDTFSSIARLAGTSFGDILIGDANGNVVRGGSGNDSIRGQAGNDLLSGDAGADNISGGLGDDRFSYAALTDGGDTINDFANAAANNDSFAFKGTAFGGLPIGALAANHFTANTTGLATTANHRFIYETDTGILRFDSNGTGAGGVTVIANLAGTPTLTAADFVII